jgi:hypothetical protein
MWGAAKSPVEEEQEQGVHENTVQEQEIHEQGVQEQEAQEEDL